ncbi:MAG: hypothetical protein D6681_12875 [Calditrichaeota bacterium]|nr:MAG: hypothetical protein D6681_12875 [Calditrichota bacterium]
MVHEIPILKPAAREQLFHDLVEYYCPEHCPEHGYCWNCGFYQGDSEEFRRNGGLCPDCAREMDSRFL